MSHPQPAVLTAVQDQDDWQPHAAEEFQQVGTVGKIAVGLLGASTVTHLLSTWSDWNTYSVVHRYLGGMPNVDDADLNRADAIAKVTAIPNVIVSVAAAVVFVIWLWRARVNSEVFCQADHRRSHGWVLASWFVPGPNLWYPKQIVDDVWLASDPKTPVYTDDLRRFRTPSLTSVWWVAWVAALAFDVVVRRFLMWMEATVGSLRGIALAGTASLVLTAVSAVAATMVIRKINHMQTTRQWVPWWDQGPKLSAVPAYETGGRPPVPSYANDDTDEQPAISEPIAPSPVPASLGLVREPQLQPAGGVPGSPFAPMPQQMPVPQQMPMPQAPAPQQPQQAPAAFAGDPVVEESPKWSPFAPVVETWQEQSAGPATEQFSPISSWQEEKAEQPAYEATRPSWDDYLTKHHTDDTLSTGTGTNWLEESSPLTMAQPDYSYQPEPVQETSWTASYSEPYSYETDYRSAPVVPEPAPEPEPAPVARAGRRAARVAVDSPPAVPSPVQSTAASHAVHAPSDHTVYGESDHTVYSPSADHSYYEPAPQQDDFLTPSKPLPPVPTYGPEPSYQAEDYSTSYVDASYQAPYEPDYNSSPTYTSEYGSSYESPEYGYSSNTSDYSSSSSNYGYETEYTAPGTPSSTPSSTEYETYSPNYATESYSSQYDQTGYSEQQQPYSYQQQPQQPEQPDDDPTPPRTLPRRRWT